MTTSVAGRTARAPVRQLKACLAFVRNWRDHFLPSNSWREPVLATLIVHIALMGLYLAKNRGDVSEFLCMGANRIGTYPYEAVPYALGPSGHDGQFYYALARSPWSIHGPDIDLPAGRHLRIFYPALCWCLTGGNPILLFYVMPLVNLLAIAGIAAIGVQLARHYGRSPWWGFMLPVGLNLGISLLHNFTDCVSSLAAVGLLASYFLRQRWWVASVWAAVAMLSREQNVAVAGLIGLTALWERRWALASGLIAAGALWLAWVGTLWDWYGTPPFLVGCNFSAPFTGMIFRLQHLGDTGFRISTRLATVQFLSIFHLLVLVAVAIFALARPQQFRVNRLIAMGRSPVSLTPAPENQQFLVRMLIALGLVLTILGSPNIYMDFASYLRVFIWVPLGLWLAFLPKANSCWSLLFVPGFFWSLAAALRYV